MITAFAVVNWTLPTVLTGLAAVAGFFAHEPLLILLGRRGTRMRREARGRAISWLLATGAVTVVAGVAAVRTAPATTRWSYLFPLGPLAVLVAALWSDREKTAVGEIAAALTFSLIAVPMCLAGRASLGVALAIGLAFAALFSTSTLGVRVVILRVRGGGDPRRVRTTQRAALGLTALVAVGLVAAASRAVLPWAAILAIAPGLVLTTVLAVRPPSPVRVRTVGWTLVATSSIAVVTLIALLAGVP